MLSARHYTWVPLELTEMQDKLLRFAEEIDQVPPEQWFQCHYRESEMLALMSEAGSVRRDRMGSKLDIDWTEAASQTPELREFLDQRILPLFQVKPRIIAIRTQPRSEMPIHFDCHPHELEDELYKVRLVLRGDLDTLYFKGVEGQRHWVSSQYPFYLMDGTHPHGLVNRSQGKLTLAFGSPWKTIADSGIKDLVERSLDEHPGEILYRDKIGRPVKEEWFRRPEKSFTMKGG